MHGDATSVSKTFGTCSGGSFSIVDFHGFSVLSKHKKYLEIIYKKRCKFKDTCIVQNLDIIFFTLDALGKALVITDALWSNIALEKLRLMLRFMDDVTRVGFKLDFIDSFASRS